MPQNPLVTILGPSDGHEENFLKIQSNCVNNEAFYDKESDKNEKEHLEEDLEAEKEEESVEKPKKKTERKKKK
jgi:hypothetical protein